MEFFAKSLEIVGVASVGFLGIVGATTFAMLSGTSGYLAYGSGKQFLQIRNNVNSADQKPLEGKNP